MSTLEAPIRKTLDCPPWCTANHRAGLHVHEEARYKMRVHYGSERVLPEVIDEDGKSQTASVALIQVDDLTGATRGPVGINALCEGVLTPEQAETFAAMVQDAATEARRITGDEIEAQFLTFGMQLLTSDGWQTIQGINVFGDHLDADQVNVYTDERNDTETEGWAFRFGDRVRIRPAPASRLREV